ncbi:MAG: transglycosylase domain-containing protein [Alphaproteobacteria bacterium]|nr:transglycosylase domain-containing protein [Alphaproteobacteria bacterium]
MDFGISFKKRYLLFLLLIVIGFYYSCVISSARDITQGRVSWAESQMSDPISNSEISDKRLSLLLKVQDENFFTHGGTDFLLGRMTTISQSLVKYLYFENFQKGIQKIRQSLIARFAFDPLVSKDKQLNLFLNLVYMGQVDGKEVRGFNQAAHVYFNKDLSDISDEEYLSLLVMLSSPNGLNVKNKKELNLAAVADLKQKLSL